MTVDDATFEEIVNNHYASLYRFAWSLARREAEAADLTQETFTQFARKGHQVQDPSKVKTWLFTTLYRAFVDSCRRDARHPHVELDAADADLPATPPTAGEKLDAAAARAALLQLDDVYRAPLTLFYLEEHSYLEIAEILGVPIGTVMSRLARGRAALRRRLEDKPNGHIVPLETAKKSAAS